MLYTLVSVDQASTPTNPILGPGISELNHGSLGESCLVGWITIHHSALRWLSKGTPTPSRTVDTSYGNIMLWGKYRRVWDCVNRADQVAVDCPNNILDQLHTYMLSAFWNLNGVFEKDNAAFHRDSIASEWFQVHNTVFHLRSFPPNSTELNPILYMLILMKWQLRTQIQPCWNILDLCGRTFNNLYNLSLDICEGIVASMPRWVAVDLLANDWPMSY